MRILILALTALAVFAADASAQFPFFRRKTEPARSPAPPTAPQETGAVFRPFDVFELSLSGIPPQEAVPFRQMQFTIGGDGFISLPYAGQVKAAGLTQSQLERAIVQKYIDEQIFKWPVATITVPQQARYVTIGGNVRVPQRMPWAPDLTLLAAISAAGGSGDFGGDKVNLTRGDQVVTYSIKRLKRNPSEDPSLMPGDKLDLL